MRLLVAFALLLSLSFSCFSADLQKMKQALSEDKICKWQFPDKGTARVKAIFALGDGKRSKEDRYLFAVEHFTKVLKPLLHEDDWDALKTSLKQSYSQSAKQKADGLRFTILVVPGAEYLSVYLEFVPR
jgi:hypothetical protein